MIQLSHVSKKYVLGEHTVYALKDVSLHIGKGEFVAITGPSGCGKSSLLYVLGLLDSIDQGSYELFGKVVHLSNENETSILRRNHIGFVFQQFNLIPRISAIDNVTLPSVYQGGLIQTARGKSLLTSFGLGDRLNHKPNELSGGQQQRVAISRALIHSPQIILADEPTGALDSKSSSEVLKILKELHQQGNTVILVTHDPSIAAHAERSIVMKDGTIVSDEDKKVRPLTDTSKTRDEKVVNQKKIPYQKYFYFAASGFKLLLANKVRSGLSMLGILIGVASVVTMLAVGKGAREAIKQELSGLGSNLLVVRKGSSRMPGASSGSSNSIKLTVEDAMAIKQQVEGVANVSPAVYGQVQSDYLNRNWNTDVTGVDFLYPEIRSSVPTVGRFFTQEEIKQKARLAILGKTVLKNLFPNEDPIGKWIRLNKISFQVIGLLPEKGASTFRDQDDVIVVPYTTAQYRVLGKDSIDYIDIQMQAPEQMAKAKESIESLIIQRHRIPPALQQGAVTISNMSEIQNALSATTKIVSMLLSIVAAIAMLVGGIGIMNMMLVTVTERTKEIGLRKAVGANRQDILFQFLIESILLSMLGGFMGMGAGIGLTLLIAHLAGWVTSLSISTIVIPMLFSSAVGVFFGLYPAYKASRLSPLQALRYE